MEVTPLFEGNAQTKRQLIKLAGEILSDSIVSYNRDDWPDQLRWAEVKLRAARLDEQHKRWAVWLRDIADSLDVAEYPGFNFKLTGGNKR